MDQRFNCNGKHCSIDLNEALTHTKNDKKKVARKRWALLAKALKSPSGSEPSSPTDEYPLRRISPFMLVNPRRIETVDLHNADVYIIDRIKKYGWYKYSSYIEGLEYFVHVSHRNRTFSAEDLMGFNNTGNVCIWPSEETLAYYSLFNLSLFKSKSVIELGGGMSCLAGLFCAKYGYPKNVILTDGNKVSVENIQISLCGNDFPCPVECRILKWNQHDVESQFDVILCADCLFFDDARADLVKVLWQLLSEDGVALVMAPKRGHTLDTFILQCENIGFSCEKIVNYNDTVWNKHVTLLHSTDYDENSHYPVLIQLTKSKCP